MRVVLAIVVGLACPLAAAAQPAGDRYGPASAQQIRDASASAYQGRALSWSSKQVGPQQPAPAQPAYSPSAAQPQPSAQAYQQTLPPPPTRYQPPAPAYVPFQPQVPLPLQQPQAAPAKAVQRSPSSIYGAAGAAPVPQQAPARLAAATPAAPPLKAKPAATPATAPQRLAQAASAQPALQRVAQAGPHPGGTPRLYSVHRDFGMTPDAIEPTKGDRYVLIGPPDAPAPKSKTDDDDDAPDARPGAF